VTWLTWSDVGAYCAAYWSAEMNCPYCAFDGSLTACASASSWAAFLGVSQTCACTRRPGGTAAVCGAAVVHDGLVPGRTWRFELNGPARPRGGACGDDQCGDRHCAREYHDDSPVAYRRHVRLPLLVIDLRADGARPPDPARPA
jgi:hypothetical protein